MAIPAKKNKGDTVLAINYIQGGFTKTNALGAWWSTSIIMVSGDLYSKWFQKKTSLSLYSKNSGLKSNFVLL